MTITGQQQPRTAASTARRVLLVTLLLLTGLAGAGGGALLLGRELTRHATTAEATAAEQQELATRWQRLSAGQIFPERVPYITSQGFSTAATLAGIAPQSSCTAATDRSTASVLNSDHCLAMLRATYSDASGTVIATMGVAVMASGGGARSAAGTLAHRRVSGVLALAFPGTVSQGFSDAAREIRGVAAQGTYVFFFTAGYADGRVTTFEPQAGESATLDLATSVRNHLERAFAAPASPCADRYIAC